MSKLGYKTHASATDISDAVEAMANALTLLESNGYTDGGDIVDGLACFLTRFAADNGIDLLNDHFQLPAYMPRFIESR